MDSYTPGSLRESFLKELKKELELSEWIRKNWKYQNIKVESTSWSSNSK